MALVYSDEMPDAAELAALEAVGRGFAAGHAAFHAGAPRIVPGHVMYVADEDGERHFDHDATVAWYRGWDTANLAEPVPGLDGPEHGPVNVEEEPF